MVKRPGLTFALFALTFGVSLVPEARACGRCGGGRTYTYNGYQGSYSSGPSYAQAPSSAPQPVSYAPQAAAYPAPQAGPYDGYQAAGQAPPAAAQPPRFRMMRRR